MSGCITTEYTAWCGRCSHWEQESEARKRDMEKVIRARGWKKVKGLWVCPKCLEKSKA